MASPGRNTNVFFERRVFFSDGLKQLKRTDGLGCSAGLLTKWAHKGLINREAGTNGCGARIYLEHMRVGGRLMTSKEAFWRFFQRLSGENVKCPVSQKKPKGD